MVMVRAGRRGKNNRLIEGIHLKMLETGRLEDQVDQRQLYLTLTTPPRKSIRRLHANKFLFNRNSHHSIGNKKAASSTGP